MFGEESEREQFFEAAKLQAISEYEKDNKNVQALIRWGGALLELAHFKQGDQSQETIEEAISKLKKALELDPESSQAQWCLGNAYTSLGFLCPDKTIALGKFKDAAECFKDCVKRDPTNETYKKAIEMCEKAPEFYDEIQAHIASDRAGGASARGAESAGGNDIWWEVGGWVLLGAVVVGALVLAKSSKASA
uniref:Mitochondrial import receptor subunit TOM20 n=1 Tax=Polytomella parva TaxID=51329 RepID=A0A7S0VMK6_9CHLO|mmetsp:Transcript_9490/g.17765  ORF Transcript_9490/g.17765 Transcript_9490/m.17765 type:complete len:192 (+) Transcript_9490:46-621(+)|eukprot:CAMPEP_0175054626 /NCGR_PEP_ID=MMETSP0052_2-20121109/9608_1 /TAXON_ID=51329 ORGANISM="Polytomella parva, Strain SAG 63-3" /NCGR_SAMPLE_ID=MMETSP0052_2 /ASSEMBLY_ACC=CAM_ASM_000194 /LENGTH=191 /DNA_ID=CAMNT_0016319339 /DNA_START=26 /DNA_END=601 /DNA_ORIENTATION=+